MYERTRTPIELVSLPENPPRDCRLHMTRDQSNPLAPMRTVARHSLAHLDPEPEIVVDSGKSRATRTGSAPMAIHPHAKGRCVPQLPCVMPKEEKGGSLG